MFKLTLPVSRTSIRGQAQARDKGSGLFRAALPEPGLPSLAAQYGVIRAFRGLAKRSGIRERCEFECGLAKAIDEIAGPRPRRFDALGARGEREGGAVPVEIVAGSRPRSPRRCPVADLR